MLSFTPTEDQQALAETIHRYAINDVRPAAHEADETKTLPERLVAKAWELGLVPAVIPETLGGFGDELSALTGAIAAEELAYGDLSLALAVMSSALLAYPVLLYGTAEQRAHFLPLFLEEAPPQVTAALLEPGIHFNPRTLTTTAKADGEQVCIAGTKAFVPLAEAAAWMLVYARDSVSGAVEAFIVDTALAGVSISQREALMGLGALPLYRVQFDHVHVDINCRLGGTAGMDYDALLNRQQVALAAMAVGVARGAYDYARDYAKERVQFGRPIAQNQAIAFMLAEAAIETDAARLMVWEAAWRLDRGKDASREAYLAKQYADKTVMQVTDSAVQVLGGYGFIREYPVERWLRNGRGFPTFHGLAMV
jgi:alkylation response protein AidB-like acyl-CoA dehydrogenase